MKKIIILFLVFLILAGCSKKIDVTFDSDNNSEITSVTIEKGQIVGKPVDPIKEGYQFLHWLSGEEEYDFSQPVDKNLSLKAAYIKLHTVIFKVDDEIFETRYIKDCASVISESSLPEPSDKDDFDFIGWQSNGADFDLNSPVTSDMLLVANYRQRVYTKTIKLTQSQVSLGLTQVGKIEYTLVPADTTETPTFQSGNENIVHVDEFGNLTPVSTGQTYIVIKTSQASVKVKITVAIFPDSITLDKKNAEIMVGDTLKLVPEISPANATNKSITYSSSDNSIATVDANGTVTGIKQGKATITAITSNNKKTTCEIIVKGVDVIGLSFDKSSVLIPRGQSITLKATVVPLDATDKSVSFSSLNPEIVSIDKNGKITAKSKGTTTIVATSSNGKTATCNIEVFVKVDSISLLSTRVNIACDGSKDVTFTAIIKPSDADFSSLEWDTSNNVGGTNTAFSFSVNNPYATLTAKEASRSDNVCSVYAFISNKDGTQTNSNTITITAEDTLKVYKEVQQSPLDERMNYSTDIDWIYPNNGIISLYTNIPASFTFGSNSSITISDLKLGSTHLTGCLSNLETHQSVTTLLIETKGGQEKIVSISVNN